MIYSHADLEIVLRGFNVAYNSRRQRMHAVLPAAIYLGASKLTSPTFQ